MALNISKSLVKDRKTTLLNMIVYMCDNMVCFGGLLKKIVYSQV